MALHVLSQSGVFHGGAYWYPPCQMPANRPARRFFFLLLAAAAVLMALVVRPLATPLFLATVLAGVLWPVHRKLTIKLGGRSNVASAVVALSVVVLLVAPLVSFSTFIVAEGSEGLTFVSNLARSEGVTQLVRKLPGPLEEWADELLSHVPQRSENEEGTAKAVIQAKPSTNSADGKGEQQGSVGGGKIAAAVAAAAKATGSLIFQATMMLIALYFLLLHGEELVSWLDGVLPLPHGQTRELLMEFKGVSYAVVVSSFVTAGVQALAAMVGYFIARVPHPLFFTAVTFFVAFIPAIGAASVCVLASLILLATGHPYMALFLAIWGFVVVGLVDNLVKPMLIKSGMKMNGAIVFFSLIGGMRAFGSAGLLIGPLAVALFMSLLRIYKRDFKRPASP